MRGSRAVVTVGLPGLVLALAALPAQATILDPAWTETTWLATVSDVTGMAWAPDGSRRLFLIRKGGEIRIVNSGPPPALVTTPFATVSPVFTGSECGLIGIAFDPDFLFNGYVYVFVTVSSSQQQIIRYTAVGNTGTAKTTIVSGLPTIGANHDGGAVGFGRDGKLYWSIGDLGNGTGVDGDLASLASKAGRANRDGSLPADNPFADGAGGNNDYIFAVGFRNPYTFTFQPATGTLWVDVAGSSYEQVFAVRSADHAGWNNYENTQPVGFLPPAIKYRTNGVDMRTIAAGGAVRSDGVSTFTTTGVHGFRKGERLFIAGVSDPSFDTGTTVPFYVASTPTATTFTLVQSGPDASSGGGTATTQNQGGAITGGTFYDSSGAPEAYRGNFFYGDFNSGRIMRAVVGPGTTVQSVDYFVTGNTNHIDVSVGPDGALYYVGFGGIVRRAAYTPTAQGIVVSHLHRWMTEDRSAAFSVRLAVAPASSTTVQVARTSGSTDVQVASGSSLIFTPFNFAVPQTVTLSALADADANADQAIVSVSSSGMTTENVEVIVADSGAQSGGFFPGRVPAALTLAKSANPGHLDLTWNRSCSLMATDYSVHEGSLGNWYTHDSILCTTGGATAATITPGPDSHYYLIVPQDDALEGSYGTDSASTQRPVSFGPCRAQQNTTPCP
jgi:glucose/arabinose dehydrogenase